MPTKRQKITKMEQEEHLASCAQLQRAGIPTGTAENSRFQRRRFALEQVDPELARVYDLPDGSVVVAFFARLTIKTHGVMFTDAEVLPPWDEWPLDLDVLEDLREKRYYDDVVRWSPASPPIILNPFLVRRSTPLRPCQHQGLIIAAGWSTSMTAGCRTSVPPECRDEERVVFQLRLTDEQGLESSYNIVAPVDRSMRRRYERRRPTQQEIAERLAKRRPLFDQEKDQTCVQWVALGEAGPEPSEQSLSGKHRVTI